MAKPTISLNRTKPTIDDAIRAVRSFQGGRMSLAAIGDILEGFDDRALRVIAVATRTSTKTLKELKGEASRQHSLKL